MIGASRTETLGADLREASALFDLIESILQGDVFLLRIR